jgi:hypothetical protein
MDQTMVAKNIFLSQKVEEMWQCAAEMAGRCRE